MQNLDTLVPAQTSTPHTMWARVIGFSLLLLVSACSTIERNNSDSSPQDQTTTISTQTETSILFSDGDWQERIFAGSTHYQILDNSDTGSGEVLKASADASASMLYKVADIDLTQTPFIQWDWKITNTYKHSNERDRKGDDFPARVYIAIASKSGSIFPRALTYVWSSNSVPLSSWKNPYTNAVVMLSLQNGEANSQQWLSEKRNLKKDLARYFGEDIDNITGIAVMTDADNTGASAVSFYRNLRFTQQ